MKISEYKKGDKGIACMPLKSHIPDAPHPDWKLVNCPICKTECWECDLTRQVKADGCDAYCTKCALRAGGT